MNIHNLYSLNKIIKPQITVTRYLYRKIIVNNTENIIIRPYPRALYTNWLITDIPYLAYKPHIKSYPQVLPYIAVQKQACNLYIAFTSHI